MHALRRDVANTAKSVSTTRRSVSSASDVTGPLSSEEKDQSEQRERRPPNDVQRHLRKTQPRRDRLDDAHGDSHSDEAGGERKHSPSAVRFLSRNEATENDRGKDGQLERARIQ